jgi:predicted ATP-grasp superfamily ATP-dependent carboligase
MIPAVVLSTHTVGRAVIRALGMMNVPVIAVYYEKNDMGHVSKYVKDKLLAPHPEKHEEQFISLLIDCADRIGRGLLLPADDATLSVVSKNKDLLDQYFIVACPEWEIVEKFIDKKHTYALAEEIGVPAPRTLLPESAAEVERYGEAVQFPCLVKPCRSHRYFELFKKKAVRVENVDQMLVAYNQATEAGVEVMLQELIPGGDTQGVNYNSYSWDGKPLVEFTAQKVRLSPPHFGVPRVVISKDIPEIIKPARKFLKAMGFYGYSCTEFKKDERDGIYKLMEVNGRHNRSELLSVRCGINFPWLEYRHLTEGELPSASAYRHGVYWIDEFRDIFQSARSFKKERYSLIQYLRPYLSRHVFATFDLKDPKPFIK